MNSLGRFFVVTVFGESVIRLLIHARTPLTQSETRHIYLDGAEKLRPDLFTKKQDK